MTKIDAVDCQSFAGGFTLGTVQAGFQLRGKREMPGGFGVPSTSANGRHLTPNDPGQMERITQVSDAEEWEPVPVPYVFGNPPCSGFSLLSHKDFRGADSPINACMWAFAEYAAKCHNLLPATEPVIAVFESVQPAYTQGRSLMQRLRALMESKTGRTYNLTHVLHNSRSLGGCAERKRYFAVFSTFDLRIDEPDPLNPLTGPIDHLPTLRESIGDLEGLYRTYERQPYRRPAVHQYAARLRSRDGAVDGHFARTNPALARAYDLVEDWAEGENISMVARRYYQKHGRLPASWQHQADKLIAKDFQMGFYQLHRWKYDSNARVVTGAGTTCVLHPTEPRSLSQRECVRIQGFPDDWVIRPLRSISAAPMFWGKGIPVNVGLWMSTWVRRHLEDSPGDNRGEQVGEREVVFNYTNVHRSLLPKGRIQ